MGSLRWLLSVSSTATPDELADDLAALGCTRRDLDAIPLDEATEVLFAEGPSDVDARVRRGDAPNVLKASPDSEPQPY